jgi:hypothetical protein
MVAAAQTDLFGSHFALLPDCGTGRAFILQCSLKRCIQKPHSLCNSGVIQAHRGKWGVAATGGVNQEMVNFGEARITSRLNSRRKCIFGAKMRKSAARKNPLNMFGPPLLTVFETPPACSNESTLIKKIFHISGLSQLTSRQGAFP